MTNYHSVREDRVGCPLCNNRPEECQRHRTEVHNTYPPVRVHVKFALTLLGVMALGVFIIYCAAKAVR